MPDRNLREVALSQAHRLAAMESKQRAMTTRVWPGAMRTADADSFTPVTSSTFSRLVELEALPGRWSVWGQFDLRCTSVAASLRYEFKLAAYDKESQIAEESGDYDFPVYYDWSDGAATNVRFPVSLLGHFSNQTDDNKIIAIICRDVSANSWVASNIRLNLIPR